MEENGGERTNKERRRIERHEGRKRLHGGWVKVMFKLALGELLPWKCFDD